jgi:hypothetical protein
MEPIPEKCISFLPFAPETIASWCDGTDLSKYMRILFDKGSTIIDEAGNRFETNYAKNARKAKPALAAIKKKEATPDFWNDKNFGLVAKYYVAWDGLTRELLSGSAFFSIAHVLESGEELDCSLLLASQLYYKHALQVSLSH